MPYREEGSTYESNGRVYDLNPIFAAAEGLPPRRVRVSQLLYIFNGKPPSGKRVDDSDPSVPILLTRFEGRTEVVDGSHRLAKANREGKEFIPAKLVPPAVMRSALAKKS